MQRYRCGRGTLGLHFFQERQLGAELRQHPEEALRQPAHEGVIETSPREEDDIDGERMDRLILPRYEPAGMISERKKGYIVRSRSTAGPRIGRSRAPASRQVLRIVVGNARNREGGVESVVEQHPISLRYGRVHSCTSPGEK